MTVYRYPTPDEVARMSGDELTAVLRSLRTGRGWDETAFGPTEQELDDHRFLQSYLTTPTTLDKVREEQLAGLSGRNREILESGRSSALMMDDGEPSLPEQAAAYPERRDSTGGYDGLIGQDAFAAFASVMEQTRQDIAVYTPFDEARETITKPLVRGETYQSPSPSSPFPGFASVARTFPSVMEEGARGVLGRQPRRRTSRGRRRRR